MRPLQDKFTFAALGDVHGQLDRAVELVQNAAAKIGQELKFVLQVGDLEAHRCVEDMASMYAPHHHKHLGDFTEYYSGRKTFPLPLYFIGGNHEPYQFLDESASERGISPNISFLGRVGSIDMKGLKIAYLTGIFDEKYYLHLPGSRLSVAHDHDYPAQRFLSCYTEAEVDFLLQYPHPDILLVHEWPFGIVRPEDHEPQEPAHRHLRYDGTGVQVIRAVVDKLQPRLVLCGHMHRRYRAIIHHGNDALTEIHCLGLVDHTTDGVACFSVEGDNMLEVQL